MPILNFKNKMPSVQSLPSDNGIFDFLHLNGEGDYYVNADEALHNSDIYSIIFQLSADLASAQLYAESSRTQQILSNPNSTASAHSFWQSMFAQALLGGESFAYRFRNANGTDARLEYLRPSQVSAYLLNDGSGLVYNLQFDEPEIGYMEAVPASNLIHIRLLSKNGGMSGISPLTALANELSIKKSSDQLTLKALSQSVTANGIVKVKNGGKLNAKQKLQHSATIQQQLQNGTLVLDDLEDYEPLEVKSNVANLLNQVTWTGTQIAKAYGVPDTIINGKGDQQSSIEMEQTVYVKALNRYVQPIVSELTSKFAGKVGMDIRPAVDPMGDTIAEKLDTMVKDGTLTMNQAQWELQRRGFLSTKIPAPKLSPVQQNQTDTSVKGGETDDNS